MDWSDTAVPFRAFLEAPFGLAPVHVARLTYVRSRGAPGITAPYITPFATVVHAELLDTG